MSNAQMTNLKKLDIGILFKICNLIFDIIMLVGSKTHKIKDAYNRFVMDNDSGSFCNPGNGGVASRLGRAVYRYKMLDDSGEQVASIN